MKVSALGLSNTREDVEDDRFAEYAAEPAGPSTRPPGRAAWAEFQEIYDPLVRRLAIGRGLQEADAADLTQEVFQAVAKAIERWGSRPGAGAFRGWLLPDARNLIINFLAAQKRHPRGTGDSEFQAFLEQQLRPG